MITRQVFYMFQVYNGMNSNFITQLSVEVTETKYLHHEEKCLPGAMLGAGKNIQSMNKGGVRMGLLAQWFATCWSQPIGVK